jgi:hypothetical protein
MSTRGRFFTNNYCSSIGLSVSVEGFGVSVKYSTSTPNKKEKTFKPFIDPDRDPFDEARYIYDNRFEFCNIY